VTVGITPYETVSVVVMASFSLVSVEWYVASFILKPVNNTTQCTKLLKVSNLSKIVKNYVHQQAVDTLTLDTMIY
jgi:hypothetical protein